MAAAYALLFVIVTFNLLNTVLTALAVYRGSLQIRMRNWRTGEEGWLDLRPTGNIRRHVFWGIYGVIMGALLVLVGWQVVGVAHVLDGVLELWIAWTLWRRKRRGKPSWATGVVRRIGDRLAIVPIPQGAS